MQQIRGVLANATKIAILWDATTGTYQLDAIRAAAKTASVDLVVVEFSDDNQLETTLSLGLKENPQAVIQLGSPLVRQAGPRVAQILSTHRIPGIHNFEHFLMAVV